VTNPGLGEWIERARVTYEVISHVEVDRTTASRVGFDLVLRARRPEGCTGDPTCEACDRSIERLLAAVEACLPASARHEHEPFDHSFHLRPETGFMPELQIVVAVLHPTGTFEEVDEADRALVDRVTRALEALGVQPRVFRARPD
jgi:hypothetical protein